MSSYLVMTLVLQCIVKWVQAYFEYYNNYVIIITQKTHLLYYFNVRVLTFLPLVLLGLIHYLH